MSIIRKQASLCCGVAASMVFGSVGCALSTSTDPTQAAGNASEEATALRRPPSRELDSNTRFYAPPPKSAAVE